LAAKDSDRDWEWFGETDPYYAVLTDEKFRASRITSQALEDFFQSGEQYVEALARELTETFGIRFGPDRALDFGCGVGRILIPLSRRSGEVVGVDVSASMLAQARRHLAERAAANVALVKGDDRLARVSGTFDFIHSFIVFQHLPVRRGEALTRRLLELLREDGIGALHYTYHVEWPGVSKWTTWAKLHIPLLRKAVNAARGRPVRAAAMQMNEYSLARLVGLLTDGGCGNVVARFTRHGDPGNVVGHGVMLLFRKERPSAS
jgi:SAM-dependent methyltransferase